MDDETLLGDLCSICNTAKSKYRCPGCAARTCSLPCYKRHQQWAQCNGKRDPTTYVKKSQLATPAGIDHDFNFLTSIERGLEKAEQNVNITGFATASPDPQKEPRRGQVDDKAFARVGVKVLRAPEGLSRRRENQTHRNKKRNIMWTVEWIRLDKSRSLSQTTERAPLYQAYQDHIGQPHTKKRKRGAMDSSSTKPESSVKRSDQNAGIVPGETGRTGTPADGDKVELLSAKELPLEISSPDIEGSRLDVEVAADAVAPCTESAAPEHHFFLHRPRTSSSRQVLIPITPTITLSECLRGRTVLEFPTIYVFPSPHPPPGEFMLEDEYAKQEGEDKKELEDIMKDVKPEILRAIKNEGVEEQASDEVDGKRILDVLKQDLGGAIGVDSNISGSN